jgi:uncharacterized protein YdeI (YjbR/CyaY-like superfamily)
MSAMTIQSFHPKNRAEWRKLLASHHANSTGIWLVLIKKGADIAGIMYNEAVKEALCFGWIDSSPAALGEQRYKLYFSPRKPKSLWSRLNKQRIREYKNSSKMDL